MFKRQHVIALALLLLIPVLFFAGGELFNLINPELGAGHPHYVANFYLLSRIRNAIFPVTFLAAAALWVLVCLLVIRARHRSLAWLALGLLGPFGLAVLVMLDDRASDANDGYARFVGSMRPAVRMLYEAGTFVAVWVAAYQAMLLLRLLILHAQAAQTGLTVAQIIDQQNASSGMWAFGEGLEVLFFVALAYLVRPLLIAALGSMFTARAEAAEG